MKAQQEIDKEVAARQAVLNQWKKDHELWKHNLQPFLLQIAGVYQDLGLAIEIVATPLNYDRHSSGGGHVQLGGCGVYDAPRPLLKVDLRGDFFHTVTTHYSDQKSYDGAQGREAFLVWLRKELVGAMASAVPLDRTPCTPLKITVH